MPAIDVRTNEFSKGFFFIVAVCVFAGTILIIVIPDNTHHTNRFLTGRSALFMPTSDTCNNGGRAPPAPSRGRRLNPAHALDEMFRYAASELRQASRPLPNRSAHRLLLRRR